jgi:ribosomal protein S18 acetylase RimI-like enzyme
MLQFTEDLCRRRGIRSIWLTVNRHNADSIAWYAQMGFSNTGPIFQEIGGGFAMDDFRMGKAID